MTIQNKYNFGFTLIEVLVVIAIIGILSTMVVVAVRLSKQKAEIAKAQHDIDVVWTGIEQLVNDSGEWPGHQLPGLVNSSQNNELWDLSTGEAGLTQSDGLYNNWSGPYILEINDDPWGNKYFFDTDYSVNGNFEPCDGGTGCFDVVVIGSFGPNGLGQNLYDGDDIIKVVK